MHLCPRDFHDLKVRRIKGLTVSSCDRCEGLWLPSAVVATAVGHLPNVHPGNAKSTGAALQCPADGTTLLAIHHRGVEIDVCPHCSGVWLDKGELDMILRVRPVSPVSTASDSNRADIPGAILDASVDIAFHNLDSVGDILGNVLSFIAEALSGF